MKLIKVTHGEAAHTVQAAIANGDECCVFSVAAAPCVIVGNGGQENVEAAKRLNIPVVYMGNEGGTIVAGEGDVDIGILTRGYEGRNVREEIVRFVSAAAESGGAAVTFDGNDVLADGKKVIGYGSRMFDGILYTAIHISIRSDLEIISSICRKPMKKIPGSLSEYGVTSEFVTSELKRLVMNVE